MLTLEELKSHLLPLQEEIKALKAQLDAEKNLRRGTMRDTRRCPACHKRKILFVEKILDTLQSNPIGVWASTWGTKHAGILQVFACANCGHAELQLDNLEKLEEKKNVRVLEPPPESEGPHR